MAWPRLQGSCSQARPTWATSTEQGAGPLYCPRTLKATTQQSAESPFIISNEKKKDGLVDRKVFTENLLEGADGPASDGGEGAC